MGKAMEARTPPPPAAAPAAAEGCRGPGCRAASTATLPHASSSAVCPACGSRPKHGLRAPVLTCREELPPAGMQQPEKCLWPSST